MRSSRLWMRSSRMGMRSSLVWMRSRRVLKASDCQCQSRSSPGFNPSILRHSGSRGRQLKQCWTKYFKNQKIPWIGIYKWKNENHLSTHFLTLNCMAKKLKRQQKGFLSTFIIFLWIIEFSMSVFAFCVCLQEVGYRNIPFGSWKGGGYTQN